MLSDAIRPALLFWVACFSERAVPQLKTHISSSQQVKRSLPYMGSLGVDPIDDLDPVRLLAHRILLNVLQLAAVLVDRMDGQVC